MVAVKLLGGHSLAGTSLTTAALLGTGLTVLAVSLGGIAGLSDDVRAASEANLVHQQQVLVPEAQWDDPVATSPTTPPIGPYDRDGNPIAEDY